MMRLSILAAVALTGLSACATGDSSRGTGEPVFSTASGVPVYRYTGELSSDSFRTVSIAYLRARPNGVGGFAGPAAQFELEPITGALFRVDGAAGSVAYVAEIDEPFWGIPRTEHQALMRSVSIRAAQLTGCRWDNEASIRTVNGRVRTIAVGLDC